MEVLVLLHVLSCILALLAQVFPGTCTYLKFRCRVLAKQTVYSRITSICYTFSAAYVHQSQFVLRKRVECLCANYVYEDISKLNAETSVIRSDL